MRETAPESLAGNVTEWLGRGLQNLLQRFESARCLSFCFAPLAYRRAGRLLSAAAGAYNQPRTFDGVARLLRVPILFFLSGLLLSMLLPGPLTAEPWQRDPVLSQLLIKQLLTDPTGFQWIATDEGVFRYDGYELVPLARLVRPGSTTAPRGIVSTLSLDPAGHLWLGADAGLFCLTLRTGVFRRVALPTDAGAAPPTVIQLFRHPRSGHLWVSCGDGYTVVLDASHRARLISRRRLPGISFRFQPDGTAAGVWISFIENRYFDPARRQERLALPGIARIGPTGPVRWYMPTNFLVLAVPGTAPQQFFSANARYELTADNRLREINHWLIADRADNFLPAAVGPDTAYEWVSRHHYLCLTVRGPRTGHLTADSLRLGEVPNPYHHNFVVYRDALGVQWCYSRAWRGVYKRRTAAPPAVYALTQPGGRRLASMRGIARLADGRLLLGTYEGPFVQAADSPCAPVRPLVPAHAWRPTLTTTPGEPPRAARFPTIYDVLTTRTHPATTVVAEDDIGFSLLDASTRQCHLLRLDSAERHQPARFLTLLEHPRGRVWGGTDSGLFELDLRRLRVRRYRPPGGASEGGESAATLRRLRILDLAADSATGHLWLATAQGLYRLHPATGALRRVGAPNSPRPLPTTDDMLCVAAAGPDRAWVGTRAEGLLLVDARRGLVQQLGIADGLPSSTVATVLCQPDRTVWAGTYAGLIRYDPAQQRLAVFGTAAGLTEAELNRSSAYADPRTGTLLFGGVGGVFQVAPTTMGQAENDRQRPIRLLVTAFGESRPSTDSGAGSALTPLCSGEPMPALRLGARATDFVEIRLALTDLLTPGFTHYAYRLRPAGDKHAPLPAWQPTTRRLVLQGLAAGDYTVEIRAETSTGQLAANIVRVPLHVARVWWQHPLTWALATLALVGFAYGLFWLQGRRARREARLRDELAANLHDEVGSLLTKISLMAEVLQQADEATAAEEQLAAGPPTVAVDPVLHQLAARLLHNSRAAVQALRDVVWSIDSRADSVQALLDRMEDHLDQTAPVAGLRHAFEAAPPAHFQALRPLVRKQLYLIFKEAVTNAVRHGKGATTLHVRLVREGSHFVLEVTDDGRAAPAPSRTGLGLRSMAARAKAINGVLQTGPRIDGQLGYQVRCEVRG